MVHRVALLVASLAAALTIAVGLTLAGFGPGSPSPAGAPGTTTSETVPQGAVQVDTVYLTQPEATQQADPGLAVQEDDDRDGEHQDRDEDEHDHGHDEHEDDR